jgi:hypothetical protein
VCVYVCVCIDTYLKVIRPYLDALLDVWEVIRDNVGLVDVDVEALGLESCACVCVGGCVCMCVCV